MPSRAMAKVYPEVHPPRTPLVGSGGREGSEQLELKVPNAPLKLAEYIRDVYAVLQVAVEKFGGVVALAAAVGKSHGEVGKRLRREEDHYGDLQRAFFDYVAVIATDMKARESFLFGLCDLWGFKHPEVRTAATLAEKYDALLSTLEGEAGAAVKERAARNGGFHVRDFSK